MLPAKSSVSTIIVLVLLHHSLALGAVRGDKAAYRGGTISTIPQGTQGVLDLSDAKELRFNYPKGAYKVPYDRITSMEFGQKVGRRVGTTIALGATTLGLAALPILFSKKKKHYLSVSFTNEDGSGGAMVLELAKSVVRTTLPTLEARTGKKVELEEATKKRGKEQS